MSGYDVVRRTIPSRPSMLPPEAIPPLRKLIGRVRPGVSGARPRAGDVPLPDDPQSLAEFEALLTHLKESHGFDFTAYKRSSLMRRVLVRMQTLGSRRFASYLDALRADPDEFILLFNTILINVTGFFRDAPHWEYLRDEVVPRLLGPPGSVEPLRVWSAGCASGEEAYSVAMLLAEAIGTDAFRRRVRIYATDADEHALDQARQAVYASQGAAQVPAPLLEKYFERRSEGYAVTKELRRSVIFGRHDLIQDAPIARVNLLLCRNCLMYFHTEAQARVLARFHFALAPRGVLFLGKAETMPAQNRMFDPLDIERRVFVKAGYDRNDVTPEATRRPTGRVAGVILLKVETDGRR